MSEFPTSLPIFLLCPFCFLLYRLSVIVSAPRLSRALPSLVPDAAVAVILTGIVVTIAVFITKTIIEVAQLVRAGYRKDAFGGFHFTNLADWCYIYLFHNSLLSIYYILFRVLIT